MTSAEWTVARMANWWVEKMVGTMVELMVDPMAYWWVVLKVATMVELTVVVWEETLGLPLADLTAELLVDVLEPMLAAEMVVQ